MPISPADSVLTAVTASTAISAKNELSGPRILELIAVLAAFTRFGLVQSVLHKYARRKIKKRK